MTLRIHNSLTREKEIFTPLQGNRVRMYACGVTTYDLCHLGHGRMYVVFDVVHRYLEYRGYEVVFVRNYTDIDDKIITRAREKGEDPLALSARFVEECRADMGALNVLPADIEPKVTTHMDEIIAMVKTLVDNGHAYVSNGDVYYNVRKFPEYGKLSGRHLDDLLAGARVEVSEQKNDPLDFALWKTAKPGEPAWDSPWGKGRPGWHIECSAMSTKYLGGYFDIHGGGIDLQFPHHENEIAQSCAATGAPFVRVWMHNGHVNVNHEKMSKSLGNFFTIRDILKEFTGESIRYFMLTTHYRSPINFHDGAVREAEARVDYCYETLRRLNHRLAGADPLKGQSRFELVFGQNPLDEFCEAMDDDFNTPGGLAALANLLRAVNEALDNKVKTPAWKQMNPDARADLLREALGMLRDMGQVFGLFTHEPNTYLDQRRKTSAARKGIDVNQVEALMNERLEARRNKDWARSDAIREQLAGLGVIVKDGAEGAAWWVE
ncbi:MAG: Cysteine--tRNA ligase [Myxococcota bacterium]|nr:Cysteine--tRNA ligase [Myxococcota bacterium]